MDIKALRCFSNVARYSSFTRAAEQLHLAQPAVSMTIKRLEQQLGLTLFHRKERKISLTDEGHRLRLHADKILQAVNDAELEMQELTGLTNGEVRVGIPSMLGSYYFPPLLMGFRHRYPGLRLSVVEGGTARIQELLEQGELDIGIIVDELKPESLEGKIFLQEQMLVCVPQDHPLAQKQSISYQEFFAEELVLFKEGFFHRQVTEQIAKKLQLIPKISFETNLIPLIQAIVRQGFGISALLNRAIEDAGDLIGIPFTEPVMLDLCIAWRKGSYLSKANSAFVDYLLEHSATAAQR
ncbi:LysR family transcriptional regulator [Amphritea sp. HPY]|uniref:LysR family transcriptional regulator n=1 Tax=Amphritea sp. HPY TaxID=3421652 RepID=UPI003D7D422B